MEPKTFGKNLVKVLFFFVITFVVLAVLYFQKLPDGKLHLIFCDVGQGDAILVITPVGDQILIDGGPDNSVLSCLGKYLPFGDRKIELMVLTHPQSDHMVGLVSVFENYKVEKVLKTDAINQIPEFEAFAQALTEEKTQEFEAAAESSINFGQNFQAEILWPGKNLINNSLDLNDTSIILRFDFDKFCAFLTGDATNFVWTQLISTGKLTNCFLLKVSHHGSKNATNELFLTSTTPAIAVISAGKNNRYGHPHEEVLEGLRERGIKILRTDIDGTIEIITDGKKVEIKD